MRKPAHEQLLREYSYSSRREVGSHPAPYLLFRISLRDEYNYSSNRNINNFAGTNTSSGYYADLTPGIVFFPVPKFGINASLGSLGFSHYRLTDSRYNDANGGSYSRGDKNENNNFTANFGLDAFQLGGTYYFGR